MFDYLWLLPLLPVVGFVAIAQIGAVPSIGPGSGVIDEHPVKHKWQITYVKCVRGRYWFPAYVVGYYRWYWQAQIVSWCVFHMHSGDVYCRRRDEG